ncbi:MAG: V-type ATP synthase subunit I [bacterium]|nr:V-type ATP synthase subunit I [bacterium]
MALAKIKKIRLIANTKQKNNILEILQKAGTVEITEQKDADLSPDLGELQKAELEYANIEFAIKLLKDFGKKKGILSQAPSFTIKQVEEQIKDFDHKKIVSECQDQEEKLIQAKNALNTAKHEIENLLPWKNLDTKFEDLEGTQTSGIILGSVKTNNFEPFIEGLHRLSGLISSDIIKKDKVENYIRIVFSKELEKEIRQVLSQFKFQEADLPESKGRVADHIDKLEKTIDENEKNLKQVYSALTKLAENLENLEIANDYFSWQVEKLENEKKFLNTEYNFTFKGWMPSKHIDTVKKLIEEKTNEYELSEIETEKDEVPPVVIENNKFLSPFESVSKIYGLPKHTEMDPTPFLAAYFIIFFALCLTDAGYGIVMFITMGLMLKFLKLAPGIRSLVKLLMYGGVITFFIGALFGGWFGLTPEQVPQALTYTTPDGELLFIFQKINALADPITVLILALILGFIQVLMGVTMKFAHDLKTVGKKDAMLDSFPWVVMLAGIGFFILATALNLSPLLQAIGKWWVIGAALVLILTQGRDKKNIVMKFFSGILSLYGLVGYMSDILSYSRLLALGLATAIIGLAVNIVAGLAMGLPYIGWLLAIVVFIGGHIFNLLINALGSFIHSGRLQFVEFFTKFMEGGGDELRPLSKKTKYIFLTK